MLISLTYGRLYSCSITLALACVYLSKLVVEMSKFQAKTVSVGKIVLVLIILSQISKKKLKTRANIDYDRLPVVMLYFLFVFFISLFH